MRTPRLALLAGGLVLAALPARVGAVGGTDNVGCYGYSDTIAPLDGNAPTYEFEDVSSTGTTFYLGDDQVGALPIGFTFNFYGTGFTKLYVSSNGFITFLPDQSNGCCSGDPIPTAFDPNGIVAGLWRDLLPLPQTLFYETLGTAPNRRFVVQFDGVPACCSVSNDPYAFEYVFSEGSNEILVRYATADGQAQTTAGIESMDGTKGIQWRYGSAFSLDAVAVRYFPSGSDGDGDGIVDCVDNCPLVGNTDQADADHDGVGDACNDADDADGDEIADALDDCPALANVDQADGDSDGLGDACDDCTDTDGDGFGNPGFPNNTCADDNCPTSSNPGQEDVDNDGIGDACVICSKLGKAADWGFIATDKVVVKTGTSLYGYIRFGAYINGPLCTTQAKLANTSLYKNRGPYPDAILVATQSQGTAVVFKGPGGGDARGIPENRTVGSIATGGGAVKDLNTNSEYNYPLYVQDGIIDTSGTHPALAECAQAKTDALAASQALAALPPTQTLGRIDVDRTDTFQLDAYGGGVFNIEALRLQGNVLGHYYGYNNKYCDEEAAGFYVNSNPDDEVILNIGQLKIGNCAFIQTSGLTIFNLPGPGKKITVGVQAEGLDWPILAPERTIVVKGSGDDSGTYTDLLWVRRALIKGYASQYNFSPVPFCGP